VPVVSVNSHSFTLGGAGNVANNLRALGATVAFVGAVGGDAEGQRARTLFEEIAVDTRGMIVVSDRPTTRKTRIVAHSQQVVRADWESTAPLGAADRAAAVGRVADAGCGVFIVHARNAWLQGLSPKDNRELPPLRYEVVHRLKRDFADLTIVLNGGLTSNADIQGQLEHLDGVMLGREAYRHPWLMADWDRCFFDEPVVPRSREDVEDQMLVYMQRAVDAGEPWSHVARHLLGLRNGLPGARRWRQVWSDTSLKSESPRAVARRAHEMVRLD